MKEMSSILVAKKFFLGSILALALFSSTHASASSYKYLEVRNDTAKASNLEVKYLGNLSNDIGFEINYYNIGSINFSFVVKDENGDILFEKTYNDKQFHKTVKLLPSEDIKGLNFSIYADNGNLLQSKDVVFNTKFDEDVLVKIH